MISSAKRAFCEQRLRLVEALGDQREHDAQPDEHEQEPDHVAVLGRELGPVLAEEAAQRLGQVGGHEPREQDRADAEQAADRPLREAEHEEADEVQDDQQIDRTDAGEERPEIHAFASISRRSGGAGSRARVAAAFGAPQGTASTMPDPSDLGGAGRSGAVRSGPEACPDVRRQTRRDGRDGGVELVVGQRPALVAQDEPVGEADLGLGERARRGRCRTARRHAGAARRGAGWPPRPRPPGGRRPR